MSVIRMQQKLTPLFPPINFAALEDDLYRSGMPTEINFEFIKTLKLKTVVILSLPSIDNSTVQFFNRNHIDVVFVENTVKDSGIPMSEDMAYAALTLISDRKNLPLLIVCKSGKNLTGVVIACLRKMQRWSLISIYEEFRRYAAGWLSLRSQQQLEQFIELFDTDPIPFDSSTAPAFLKR